MGESTTAYSHGKPQVWEINTNPTIGRGPKRDKARKPEVVEYKEMTASARATFLRELRGGVGGRRYGHR